VNRETLAALLAAVKSGATSVDEGVARLAAFPALDLGHSRVDLHRELRCGAPEVIYGAGKTATEVVDIARTLLEHHERLLATRVTPEGGAALVRAFPRGRWHERSRCFVLDAPREERSGYVLIVSAGTSDAPVAEEAALTARFFGARVEELVDVGVAGVHRLLAETERLRAADAIVVVAGMEGALPSVVGGLVDRPVIAVPTSVGYGASFGGLAALLAMLNSCAAGVTVVNIDNGFGAGVAAARIQQLAQVRK
jgi:pyridinium-3,5-biscarboxylic acid mononucleotide synthase